MAPRRWLCSVCACLKQEARVIGKTFFEAGSSLVASSGAPCDSAARHHAHARTRRTTYTDDLEQEARVIGKTFLPQLQLKKKMVYFGGGGAPLNEHLHVDVYLVASGGGPTSPFWPQHLWQKTRASLLEGPAEKENGRQAAPGLPTTCIRSPTGQSFT